MEASLASLLSFATIAAITPGGATLVAAASGAQFGFWRSMPLIAGLTGGVCLLMATSAAGLGALVFSSPTLQFLLKAAGSAYLFWLAFHIAFSGKPDVTGNAGAAPGGLRRGIVLLWLNPKAWMMSLAASGAYAGLAAGPVHLALLLGVVFGAAAVLSLSLWCGGGVAPGRLVRTQRQWRVVNITFGCLLGASVLPMWLPQHG